MTIKQQGGVFGRHPEFSTVEIDGVGTLKKSGSNLEIVAPGGVKVSGPSFWGVDVDGGLQVQDDFFRLIRNANTSYVDIGVDATSAYLKSTYSSGGTSDFRFLHNSSEIMRITGNGITFGGDTAAANALDDYEEGTWTPVATSITINSGTPVWSGTYTKVGRTVVAEWVLSGGANIDVSLSSYISLPFTAAGNSWGTYGIVSTNTHVGGMVTFGSSLYFGTASSGLVSASGTIMFQV